MSMTAPTTPMLVSGDAEEVKDSTGSDKASPTETEVPTGVSLQERERKNKDRERKRKDREAAKQKASPPVGEVVRNNQVVKSHTCFDDDGCSRDCQSDGTL
jgi:hypothetical protein